MQQKSKSLSVAKAGDTNKMQDFLDYANFFLWLDSRPYLWPIIFRKKVSYKD